MDSKTKKIINYRPKIEYVEPPPEPEAPNPIAEPVKDEDNQKGQEQLYNLANAVDILGAILQARINDRAKDMKIKLDPNIDVAAIQAMKRLFGDENIWLDGKEMFISYAQYRQCRELICNYGASLADKTAVTDDDIAKAKADLQAGLTVIDNPKVKFGGLRPELEPKAQVIDPIDMKAFQESLLKLLIRELWKWMVYKPLKKLPLVGSAIPKECPGMSLNKDFKKQMQKVKSQGISVLGV